MKTLVAYGLGDMYGGGAFMIVGLLFLFYLTRWWASPRPWPAWSSASGRYGMR